MNYNIDYGRVKRIGFPEVVYGESKDISTLKNITNAIFKQHGKVLITKLQDEKYQEIRKNYKNIFMMRFLKHV